MNIPGYDEWKLRGPDDVDEIGTHDGDVCNRFPEPDEDAPRNYRPRRCGGTMRQTEEHFFECDCCREGVWEEL